MVLLTGLSAAFKHFLLHPSSAVSLLLLPVLLLSVLKQKYTPNTVSKFEDEYDYVIIGAGSAGSVVAARLSEERCVSVLLLEAGGKPTVFSEIPVLAKNLWNTELDWKYMTVPQNNTGRLIKENRILWPSGKGIGGSSLINAMLYIRGNKKNYDDWEKDFGADGWSYSDVLPYFMKAEDNQNIDQLDQEYHSTGGPMTVDRAGYVSEYYDALLEGAKSFGYEFVDSNAAKQTGITDVQGTFRNGQRCSVAKAYLVPADHRDNLHILPHAFATKIMIENRKAVGVQFTYNFEANTVKARKEVILSAGAVNSAQILMLSGIGHREHLKEHSISVVADLPVGDNLHEHCAPILDFEMPPGSPTVLQKLYNLRTMWDYISHRKGPYSSHEMLSTMAFLNGENSEDTQDFPLFQLFFLEWTTDFPIKPQLGLTPQAYKQIYGSSEGKPLMVCTAQQLQPESRGTVRLRSSDPMEAPLIDPNYMADPRDVFAAVEALKSCEKLGTSEPMKKLGVKLLGTLYPGCEEYSADKDKYYECVARSVIVTIGHPVGTVKMGNIHDPTTVVDPKLRVKGIRSLRVVDASIMPRIPSGNTNNPTIMVAEKASDMIKESIYCG